MTVLLPDDARKARKQRRALRPTKASRRAFGNYYRALADQVRFLEGQTANLSDLIASGAERSAIAQALAAMTAEARERAARLAPQIAGMFVDDVSRNQKQAFEQSVARALGVDFARVIDDPQTAADLALARDANVALIRSISDEHHFKAASAIMDNFAGRTSADSPSLVQQLRTIGAQTDNRARLIARDQTSKVTAALNQSRQASNGIEEYIWRIVNDSRVVGKPGGLYPTPSRLHGDHYHREGKLFRWDQPPEDGHPGHAIQCRCYAEPVLDLAKLKAQWT